MKGVVMQLINADLGDKKQNNENSNVLNNRNQNILVDDLKDTQGTDFVTREKHDDFVHANQNWLALSSYKNYKKYGKGMLVVNDEDLIYTNLMGWRTPKFFYITESSKNRYSNMTNGKTLGEKQKEWIKKYDPDITVLFGVILINNEMVSYHITFSRHGLPGREQHTPIDVYKRALLNYL